MKRIFLDVETTGTSIDIHDVIEIGAVIDIAGKIVDEISIKCAPVSTKYIDPEALKVTGLTKEEILNYQTSNAAFIEFEKFLSNHINRYDKTDKFFLLGFYVTFDDTFLRKFFSNANNNYYGSWFFTPAVDIATLAMENLGDRRRTMPNFKLNTVAKEFDIDVEDTQLHGALYDAKLERRLYYEITKL